VSGGRVVRGERCALALASSARAVAEFARLAGDENPIHHDPALARGTRLGGLVVSGPELAARLMGLSATHFSRPGPGGVARAMLGLEFRFRFRRALRVGEPFELGWEVVAVRAKESLGGELAFLVGHARLVSGEDAVRALGKVLVVAQL
jgi:acyl dehydratase